MKRKKTRLQPSGSAFVGFYTTDEIKNKIEITARLHDCTVTDVMIALSERVETLVKKTRLGEARPSYEWIGRDDESRGL